tara:strand:- start:113 stop:700 length:588 start_codon:yes stop_codon:yes gene_type:complete
MSFELLVYKPVMIKEGVFYSKVTLNDSDINIQVDKNKLIIDADKNKAILDVDSKTSKHINRISEELIKQTSEKSEKWFGKPINLKDCKTLYQSALVDNVKLHCFYDENSRFYERKNNDVQHNELNKELNGISLIKCAYVIFTKSSFFIRWEIMQFKIKNDLDTKIIDYSIRDLDEHEISLDTHKKFKKDIPISLF